MPKQQAAIIAAPAAMAHNVALASIIISLKTAIATFAHMDVRAVLQQPTVVTASTTFSLRMLPVPSANRTVSSVQTVPPALTASAHFTCKTKAVLPATPSALSAPAANCAPAVFQITIFSTTNANIATTAMSVTTTSDVYHAMLVNISQMGFAISVMTIVPHALTRLPARPVSQDIT